MCIRDSINSDAQPGSAKNPACRSEQTEKALAFLGLARIWLGLFGGFPAVAGLGITHRDQGVVVLEHLAMMLEANLLDIFLKKLIIIPTKPPKLPTRNYKCKQKNSLTS